MQVLKVVQKKKAHEDIVHQIRTLIDSGKLKSGDHLPTERDLTETFKVSRTTVREAIRTLEGMKFVQSRRGNGTHVVVSSEEASVQPLAVPLFTEKDDILDIFCVRKIVEPHVARLAAQNATPHEIDKMEEILRQQAECIERGENIIETDSAFHRHMAQTAKNRVMQRLLLALVDLYKETHEKHLMDNDKWARRSLHGHTQVLSAIKNGDSVAAQASMLRHLEDIEGIIFHKKGGDGSSKTL